MDIGNGKYDGESMMKQAQHVWSMLDDMAENDPAAYRKFLDKQNAEREEFMALPEPNMCVQTQMVKPEKVPFYINFCTWKRIPPPANPEEAIRVAGSGIGQIADEKGKAAVTAIAVSEKILAEFGRNAINKTDQDTLIQIAMDFIEKQHSHVRLTRKYKILDKNHKGSVKMIQESLNHAFQTKDKHAENDMENVLKQFAPMGAENLSPETLIGQLNEENNQSDMQTNTGGLTDKLSGISIDTNTRPVKQGLIEEISSVNKSLPEPVFELTEAKGSHPGFITDSIVLTVSLPGVHSVRDCELDISKDDVSLFVEGKYDLKLTLPRSIVDEEAAAKFIKKSSTLTLTMPLDS